MNCGRCISRNHHGSFTKVNRGVRCNYGTYAIAIETKNDQSDPKRLPIFSVHVHPDGSRIATGGLDAKIRIWSTKPILNLASERSGKPPKGLCTLSMHTGPVLTVRWAHSGRWLASGSDDTVVMIWDHDPYVTAGYVFVT